MTKGFSKLEKEFKKRLMNEERKLFQFMLKYGASYRDLRLMLWFWELDACTPAIVHYAKLKGLWETRQRAIAARKKGKSDEPRDFQREDRSWSIEPYRELNKR